MIQCETCGRWWKSQDALNGHRRWHSTPTHSAPKESPASPANLKLVRRVVITIEEWTANAPS